jgi:mannan endo-1,4-beta-mannosidase
MKKKNVLGFLLFTALLSITACSDDDSRYAGFTGNTGATDEVADLLTTENARSYMVDAGATNETVALFYNLKKLSKTKYLIGQQDAFAGFYNNAGGNSDIKKATGSDPALLGSDFMFITDNNNSGEASNWFYQQEIKITNDAKDAYNKGMVNTFCWHLREPFHGDTFYAEDMTPEEKATAFASILPGGANHAYFTSKLDKVADVLNNLRGNDGKLIPVIFRPFHEFDGSWFWWGANYATPEQYKEVYKFLVTYLRDTKNVHNVIYAFSPDNSYTTNTAYLSRYPGDDYVDVLGMDNYGDFSNGSSTGVTTANSKLLMVSKLAKEKVKIAAMTETGYRVTAANSPINGFFNNNMFNALTANEAEVAYVMFWGNDQTGYYVPPTGSDFANFANKPESVLQNNIPDMYSMPQ